MPFPPRLSCPLVLASQSPRRRQLLEQVRFSFKVVPSPADETVVDPLSPKAMVRTLATRKATPVANDHPEALVVGADTVVAHDSEVLEKPNSATQAQRMLRRLSDTSHKVHTGVSLHHATSGRSIVFAETTKVSFASLTDSEIDDYVATGSPMDKAGSYGIQDHTGPMLVERLDGDYYNVVGLPLRHLYTAIRETYEDLIED